MLTKPHDLLNFGKVQKRLFRRAAFEFFWKFNAEVKKQSKRSFFQAPKPQQLMRLYTLKGWMDKYKVSLTYIVRTLVMYWQEKFSHKITKKKFGIGVSIPTLVGSMSEKILQDRIAKDFPNGENVIAWKSEQQLLRTRRAIREISGDDFMQDYERIMRVRQTRLTNNLSSGKYTRRHYRDNPWI